MTTQDIKRRITALVQLPALPHLATEVLRLGAGSKEGFDELAAIASFDPDMVACILDAANSSSEAPPVTTIEDAVPLLGVAGMRKAVFRREVQQLFPQKKSTRFDCNAFWRFSFACADYAERVAQCLNSPFLTDAYVAGLLHDIGKPVLDRVSTDGYSKALETVRSEGMHLLESERLELGADHCLAGKWLAERWGMPDALVAVIWLHHHPVEALDEGHFPAQLVEIVSFAEVLAYKELHSHDGGDRVVSLIEEKGKQLGLSSQDMETLLRTEDLVLRPPTPPTAAAPVQHPAESRELDKLSRQLRYYKTLHEMNLKHGFGLGRAKVLKYISEALRNTFDIPCGGCLAVDDVLEGRVWKSEHEEAEHICLSTGELLTPEKTSASEPLVAFVEHAAAQAVEDWPSFLQHYGFVGIPMTSQGATMGHIIYDKEACENRLSAEDLVALTSFAGTCGMALARCRTEERQKAHSESLASALLRQARTHNSSLRVERLGSVADMAAGAAHEINNPLAIIAGKAQLLMNRLDNPADIHVLESIVQQSRRATKVINDVLKFARADEPQLAPGAISQILHQMAALCRERLEEKGITLQEEYEDGLPRVPIDRTQFEQVISNLLLNAEESMASQAPGALTLRVKLSENRKSVIIQVADKGCGIPAEILDRIYEPFFTTRDAQATGLGLSVCHGIVERHGGAIRIHSTVGEGTTCTITLPTLLKVKETETTRQEEEMKETPQEDSAVDQYRILLIDEDDALREVLKEALLALDYKVDVAADGLEALAEVMAHPYDLILSDAAVKAVDQQPLLMHLKARFPEIPVIAFCSAASSEDGHEALQLGARAFLHKPFPIKQLITEINQALQAQNVA
jgi:signal transduction histidine kinase/HD-like signal output (HDOD) protein/CheY-like chemotaxis protein